MKEVSNRSALYVTSKEPFKKWASYYNEESQEDLKSRIKEKHIYLIEDIYEEDLTGEVLELYYANIFEYELMSWNGYEHEWPKNRNLELFLEWFDVKLCDDVFDLAKDEIEIEKIHLPEHNADKASAERKLQEIVKEAFETGAEGVTIEFATEGGLEVCFKSGNIWFGEVLVPDDLESAVMEFIGEQAGLRGAMTLEVGGKEVKIGVEEYESFGEIAFKLTINKSRVKKRKGKRKL